MAKKSTKKVTRKPKRVINKQSFKKKVQNILMGQVEHKKYVIVGVNNSITTAAGGGTPAALNLMPSLALGTNQEARVGEQVKITKARVHGFVNLLPTSASNPNPLPVKLRMWIVSSKLTNVTSLGSTNVGTGFFEVGSGTSGFSGDMADMMLPVNKQAWTKYNEKTVNLGLGAASTLSLAASYYDNSSFSVPFSFEYGQHFKKPLRFSDDASSLNGNFPYDRNCWLLFQAVSADGQPTAGWSTCEYHYMVDIDYTDM